jgi:hypothetical protein
VIEEDGIVTITNSGSLMGEPGTKIVLSFLALVANCYARRGPSSQNFATAGDDQIDADNNLNELIRYAEASKVTTMVPSESKWGIFRYSTMYCQQLLDVQVTDPKSGEIPVPKPRLLSAETKSGRGDTDTNPAYGKASQFAKEWGWCEFEGLKFSMILMFLRNLRKHIELRPEVFLSREWGGLGLPGIPQQSLYRLLPDWHQSLIAHRELGNDHAKKVLANWSTPLIMSRGLQIADVDIYRESITEYTPTATIDQIELQLPDHTRYREKLKAARLQGWLPVDDVVNTIRDSHTYANIWDVKAPTDRGFSTVSWGKRSSVLKGISEKYPMMALKEAPGSPSWQPGKLALVLGTFGISEITELDAEIYELEEGELKPCLCPMFGPSASPRLFLHYDNARLILNATSQQRNTDRRPLKQLV